MTIPMIDTNFVDNDKYWYDVGATYTMRVYDILQNSQIGWRIQKSLSCKLLEKRL